MSGDRSGLASGGWMEWRCLGEGGGSGGVIPEIVRGLSVVVVEGMRIEVVVVGIGKGLLSFMSWSAQLKQNGVGQETRSRRV